MFILGVPLVYRFAACAFCTALVSLPAATAQPAPEKKPDSCESDLALKYAASNQTALALSYYIAERCLERIPVKDCGFAEPMTIEGAKVAMCEKNDADFRDGLRQIKQRYAYKFVILAREMLGL